jgi:hypothetical protein
MSTSEIYIRKLLANSVGWILILFGLAVAL